MALANDPDRDWETFGKTNPYFAVLTDPKFLAKNLNDDSLQSFFDSGEHHIEHIYSVIRSAIEPTFQPARVLDYGCGAGRLLVPLAQRAQMVVGIDVSPTMLERAKENCNKLGAGKARILHAKELDSLPPATFDLVHSFIVFQHIPVDRGEIIFRKLLTLIAECGVGAIHLTCGDTRNSFHRSLATLRKRVDLTHRLFNLVNHRPFSAPLMQMNDYSMNRIFDILIEEHCSNLHIEFSIHGPHRGAMLYFKRSLTPYL